MNLKYYEEGERLERLTRHGYAANYNRGCRCDLCKGAKRALDRNRETDYKRRKRKLSELRQYLDEKISINKINVSKK